MNKKMTGVVKGWSGSKGYGFISAAGFPDAVFVHYTSLSGIAGMDYPHAPFALQEGDTVEFELAVGTRGYEARNVSKATTA